MNQDMFTVGCICISYSFSYNIKYFPWHEHKKSDSMSTVNSVFFKHRIYLWKLHLINAKTQQMQNKLWNIKKKTFNDFLQTLFCWNEGISSPRKRFILTNICSSKFYEKDKSWLQQQHYFSSAGYIAVTFYSRIYNNNKNYTIVVLWVKNVEISRTVIPHYIFFGSDLLQWFGVVQDYHCYSRWISYFHTVTCKWTTDVL